jgi:hypothetical protein
MTIKIEITDGNCEIKVERWVDGKKLGGPCIYLETERDVALRLIDFFMDADLCRAKKERFVPISEKIATKEASQIYKQFMERSPFNGKKG